MPRKFDPAEKDALLSPDRSQRLDVHRVLSIIPLQPYQKVADIGCGPGYFTIPLGKSVFDGRIYGLDVQQEMLDAAKKELDRIRLTNVDLMLTQDDKLPLEDGGLDGAFAAFVLHESEKPKDLLEDIYRCIQRGGWLALLEWHKRKMEEGPPLKERIDEGELRQMAEEAGFRFTSRHSLNDRQYMLLMRK